jgi:hypothetical protein
MTGKRLLEDGAFGSFGARLGGTFRHRANKNKKQTASTTKVNCKVSILRYLILSPVSVSTQNRYSFRESLCVYWANSGSDGEEVLAMEEDDG